MVIHSRSSIQNTNNRGSGSGKTNALLNLINNQPDTDKIYLYAKDLYEAKYQFLINNRKSIGLKHFSDPKAFIEYSFLLFLLRNHILRFQKTLDLILLTFLL